MRNGYLSFQHIHNNLNHRGRQLFGEGILQYGLFDDHVCDPGEGYGM